jgi:O-antigen/teichoic acid export membrane protein
VTVPTGKALDRKPDQDPGSVASAGRIARGLAANVAGNGLTLVIQLISVPVLLGAWGVNIYGEWLILSAIPLYVALSDLSFSTVAGNSMTMLAAANEREEAAALGRQVWSLVTAMTGATVVAAIAIAFIFGGIIGTGAAISVGEAQLVLVALFVQVAVGNQFGVLDACYRAGGRYPLGVALRQVSRLLEFGALLAAVLLGAGPGAAAIFFLAGSAVGFGASWVVVRRVVPWLSFRPARPRAQTLRSLLAPGLAFLAFPLSNSLSVQGLTIIVGGMLGAPSVVVLSTTRTVTRAVTQILQSINLSIWPELSRSIGSGQYDEARMIQRRAVQLSLIVSASAALTLLVIGPAVIRVWTHGLVNPPMTLLVVLLLVVVANSFWFTLTTSLVATNQHTRMAVVYLSSTTIAVLLAIPFSSAFGLIGAAVALLAIDLAMSAYVLPAALRIVRDSPHGFLGAILDLSGAVQSARTIGRLLSKGRSGATAGGDDKVIRE